MMAAALTRITWLPTTMPSSPLGPQVCVALLALPMFGWDIYRTGRIQRAYVIWMALYLPGSIAVQLLWDNAWWQGVVPKLMGVPTASEVSATAMVFAAATTAPHSWRGVISEPIASAERYG